MKKLYLFFVSIFLILLDITTLGPAYPVYEEFYTEAPNTVALVVGHVVGNQVRFDIFSDLLGFVLLIVVACSCLSYKKSFAKVIKWSCIAIVTNLYQKFMPYQLNGSLRFRMGYLIYYLAMIAEIITLLLALMAFASLLETTENHSYNNKTVIVSMFAAGTGFIAKIAWFYDLNKLFLVYYVIQFLFMAAYFYRVYKDRALLPE